MEINPAAVAAEEQGPVVLGDVAAVVDPVRVDQEEAAGLPQVNDCSTD